MREGLGMPWPSDCMAHWYTQARAGDWEALRLDWEQLTVPIERPEDGALVRFDNSNGGFGIGILPNKDTLITVRHHGRLIAGPRSAFGNLSLYRLA